MSRFRVLVVCVGNVCRSPLGERLLAHRLGEDYDVSSAGVTALVGADMDPASSAYLAEQGIAADGFAARQVTAAMISESDLVLTATRDIRSRVLEECPRALRRTFTVRELASLVEQVSGDSAAAVVAAAAQQRPRAEGDPDIVDPIGREPEVHRAAAEDMAQAVERIAGALLAAGRTPA